MVASNQSSASTQSVNIATTTSPFVNWGSVAIEAHP